VKEDYAFLSIYMKHLHMMPENAQNKTFSTSDDIMIYLPNGGVRIDLDNILTIDRIIYPDMLLLKQEGSHFDIIRVIDIWDENGYVKIRIQDRKTGREHDISQILDRNNGYFIWTLISYQFAMKMFEDQVIRKINDGQELEFDF